MNRNRKNKSDRSVKNTSISNISSNVPLMASINDQDDKKSSIASPSASVQSVLDEITANTNRDPKRSRNICPPKGTSPYTVASHDTLEKIALHFNATPSELLHINKLSTRMVFPGQVLYVPDSSKEEVSVIPVVPSVSPPLATTTTKPKESDAFILLMDHRLTNESTSPPSTHQHDVGQMVWSMGRQSSAAAAAKPGRAQRLKSDASVESDTSPRPIEERLKTQKQDNTRQVQHIQRSLSIEENRQLDEECLQRFIKVHVRLMTDDHKSVAGTLLVTPNAVMFDPDVLDPLVKDHGIDKYGLIIRMDLLAGIALYEDMAMYEHEATLRDDEKRRMAHSSSIKNLLQSSTKQFSSDEEQVKDLIHSLVDQIEKESDNSDVPLVLFDASSSAHRALTNDRSYPLVDDLFSALDDHKHSTAILLDESETNLDPTQGYQLENCIPVNEMSKRFGEIDKLLQKQHDIYVTPHPIEIPYYLCIKTSQVEHDRPPNSSRTTDDVYGKKELDAEYWFSVPKEKVDHLYAFFLRWSPERDSTDSSSKSDQTMAKSVSPNQMNRSSSQHQVKHQESPMNKGFVLLSNDDSQTIEDFLSKETKSDSKSRRRKSGKAESKKEKKNSHYLKRQNTLLKEWEIINVDEIYRRINETQANNAYLEDIATIPPPTLLQPSTLILKEQSKEILLELPARVHGLNWQLLFSTELHGFSLNQLYRRGLDVDQDTPSLLVVKDVEQNIFGAYISQQMMISEGFYGTGESFLFTFHPHFQVFKWTGHNQFFVKGDIKALGIGCGEGVFGLWLDADLYHGRTCPSKTFDNAQLTSTEDFIIASVEVWTFVD